jgi:hypothetical protein
MCELEGAGEAAAVGDEEGQQQLLCDIAAVKPGSLAEATSRAEWDEGEMTIDATSPEHLPPCAQGLRQLAVLSCTGLLMQCGQLPHQARC